MPRNSSGTFTLGAGNPVVPDTLIASGWANPTLADIAQSITDSLDRNGRGGMLAPLKFTDGSLAAPAIAFNSETSTGFFKDATGILKLAIQGALAATWSATGLVIAQGLTVQGASTFAGASTFNGAVSLPGGISSLAKLLLAGAVAGPTLQVNAPSDATASLLVINTNNGVGGITLRAAQGSIRHQDSSNANYEWGWQNTTSAYRLVDYSVSGGPLVRMTMDGAGLLSVAQKAIIGNTVMSSLGNPTLQVRGASPYLTVRDDTASNPEALFGAGGSAVFLGSFGAHPLQLRTNNVTRTTIDATGLLTHVAPDNAGSILLRGATRAVRFGFDGTNSWMEGVAFDQSAYTPLRVGGQTVDLTINGTSRFAINNVGQINLAPNSALGVFHSLLANGYEQYLTGGVGFGFIGTGAPLFGGASASDFCFRAENNAWIAAGGAARGWCFRSDGMFLPAASIDLQANLIGQNPVTDHITDGGVNIGSYSISWQNHSWTGVGPTALLSGYGGIRFYTGSLLRLYIATDGTFASNYTPPGIDSSARVPTTQWVQQNCTGGVGATPQAPVRAFGTNYTNNANRPMFVNVTVGFASAGTASAVVNGVTVAQVQSTAGSFEHTLNFLVPPGLVYRVNTSGAPSKDLWIETY